MYAIKSRLKLCGMKSQILREVSSTLSRIMISIEALYLAEDEMIDIVP